ncbi:TPA_exp: HPP family protein [Trichophyton benhamiae CBS 112371]|uniref:HPP family protein n=1 Tax=Arthroderma benhamiae (strain ATCC MYA-4681 / CBS 112371) TaxID=663331 RepID=D4AKC1_ARTBC|nr:HPP family protein [Trichophyton benhamiae CBS 112371]EFE36481.1 HPP family protein [Trichophyton benhamiae CBS 112371]DAA79270.1 TPA_exp: HPP family protein [Trichophyton benhamiae CBS 112371]
MNLNDLRRLEIDIDIFLNRFIPHPRWHRYPYPVAHFLGHRREAVPKLGTLVVIFWTFVGVFCGLLTITGISQHIPSFKQHDAPLVVGSFGAAAVLAYCAIESPLAQPRNAILGHFLAAVVGVGITKLFGLHPRHEELYWIAGPLCCAAATLVMALTKTVHPPAGATALLSAVDPRTRHLGWFLLPVVLLACMLILVTALIFNNIERRFPTHWWTPVSLIPPKAADLESSTSEETVHPDQSDESPPDEGNDKQPVDQIIISPGQVDISGSITLTAAEYDFLERLSRRIIDIDEKDASTDEKEKADETRQN